MLVLVTNTCQHASVATSTMSADTRLLTVSRDTGGWELLTNATHAPTSPHCVPDLNCSHTFCYYRLLILPSASHINAFRVPLL